MIKNSKHKLLPRIFAIISVIVFIFTLSINTFAETPALYSSGVSTEPYHSFSGHPFTFNTYMSSGDYFTSSVSACCTYNGYNYISSSSNSIVYEDEHAYIYYYNLSADFPDIEMDLGAINNIFPTGYFSAYMNLQSDVVSPEYDPVSYYTMEARDFYYYISPDFGSFSDENSYFEFLFRTDSYEFEFDSDPTFEMYYTLGGLPDTADNLDYYSGDALDGGILGFCPSVDLILSLLEDNPDGFLIYIDYACLTLPVSDNSIYLDGIYRSDFYYYRSADLELYDEPISPINPGIFRDYTSWIGTAVGGFLDLQIVDGFTIGGILMTLIAFMLTMWFLKVFAGG